MLAGYSMGGRLALALALRHPERVRALVLVSASPGLADAEERAARRAADDALADADRGDRRRGVRARVGGPAAVRGPVGRGRRARPRGPAAALGGRARGAAARARDRGDAAAVGSAGRARDAGDARGRGARREVPARSPSGWRSGCRTPRSSWWRAPATPSRSRTPRGGGGGDRRHAPGGALNRWRSRAAGVASAHVPHHPHCAAWTCRPHLDGGVAAAGARAPRGPRRAGDAAEDAARARQHAPHAVGARRGARGRAAALERATACSGKLARFAVCPGR